MRTFNIVIERDPDTESVRWVRTRLAGRAQPGREPWTS